MPRVIAAAHELRRMAQSSFEAFVRLGGTMKVERLVSRSWASLAFSGERHTIRLRLEGPGAGPAADAFLEGLHDREFAMHGHVLADIDLVSVARENENEVRLTLEALTVEAS